MSCGDAAAGVPQYGVTLNPDKSALLTLGPDDQVVVLADT